MGFLCKIGSFNHLLGVSNLGFRDRATDFVLLSNFKTFGADCVRIEGFRSGSDWVMKLCIFES